MRLWTTSAAEDMQGVYVVGAQRWHDLMRIADAEGGGAIATWAYRTTGAVAGMAVLGGLGATVGAVSLGIGADAGAAIGFAFGNSMATGAELSRISERTGVDRESLGLVRAQARDAKWLQERGSVGDA